MTEAEWLACADPQPMVEFLRGKMSDRRSRLYGVACARRVWHLLVDERSRRAIDAAERFAEADITEQELDQTRDDAREFADHIVFEDERYFHLDDNMLNAADAAAWSAEWPTEPLRVVIAAQRSLGPAESKEQGRFLRCIFGNPFRPVTVDPAWLTSTVVSLATSIYDERAFDRLPILADALEDAGCDNADILNHCRQPGEHVRGCWCVDLVLGRT